jgi:hypothetical protein
MGDVRFETSHNEKQENLSSLGEHGLPESYFRQFHPATNKKSIARQWNEITRIKERQQHLHVCSVGDLLLCAKAAQG